MKSAFRIGIFYAALLYGQALYAEPIHLKCAVGGPYSDDSHISWVEIDQGANSMRVKGESLPLNVTTHRYSSSVQNTRAFATSNSIDRETGEMVIVVTYEGKVVSSKKGTCERGTPPATKF